MNSSSLFAKLNTIVFEYLRYIYGKRNSHSTYCFFVQLLPVKCSNTLGPEKNQPKQALAEISNRRIGQIKHKFFYLNRFLKKMLKMRNFYLKKLDNIFYNTVAEYIYVDNMADVSPCFTPVTPVCRP